MATYKIVWSDWNNDHEVLCKSLEDKVEFLVTQGWSCMGGAGVIFGEEGYICKMYQTMVKMQG